MDDEIQARLDPLFERIEDAIDDAAQLMEARGQYLPAIATFLRLLADQWADRHPDDTNGGEPSEPEQMYPAPDMDDPTDRLAYYMSEVINADAPIGWAKYRPPASLIIRRFDLKDAVMKAEI